MSKSQNLSYCENQNITYIHSFEDVLPYIKLANHEEDIIQFFNQGLDIFNVYSKIYIDPCFSLSTINKVDLTLNERIEDMIKLNISYCKSGCSFKGVNVEKGEILCFLKIM